MVRRPLASGARRQRRAPGTRAKNYYFHSCMRNGYGGLRLKASINYWGNAAAPSDCAACCCSYIAWKLISDKCTGGKPAR